MQGDDDIAATGLSGFQNEKPDDADAKIIEAEQQLFTRLEPVLDVLNSIVDERIKKIADIHTLIIGAVEHQADPNKVVIELRARSLHLDFLEQLRSQINNVQQTIEEIRNDAAKNRP